MIKMPRSQKWIKVYNVGRIIAAVVLIIIGIAGIILPILPGWIFIIMAIFLLGLDEKLLLGLNKNKTFAKYYKKYKKPLRRREQ